MEDLPNGPDEGNNDLKNPLDNSSEPTPKPKMEPAPEVQIKEPKEQKPKKSKLGLIIALILILLAGSTAAYYFFIYESATDTTTEEAAEDEEPPSLEADVDPGLQGFAQQGVATKKSEADFLVYDETDDDKHKGKEKIWKQNKDEEKRIKTELKSDKNNLGVTYLHAYEDQSMKDIVESIGPEAKALAVLVHDSATKKWHMTPNTYYKAEAMLERFEQDIEELTDKALEDYQEDIEEYMGRVTVKAGQGYIAVLLNPSYVYGSGDRYTPSPNGYDVCSSSASGWYLVGIDSSTDWTTQIDDCFTEVKTVWAITDWFTNSEGKKKNFEKIYSRNESDKLALSDEERLANLKKLNLKDRNILWVHKEASEVQPGSDHTDECPEVNVTALLEKDLKNWFLEEVREDYSSDQIKVFERITEIIANQQRLQNKESDDLPDVNEVLKKVLDNDLFRITPLVSNTSVKKFLVTMNLQTGNSSDETAEYLDLFLESFAEAIRKATTHSYLAATAEEELPRSTMSADTAETLKAKVELRERPIMAFFVVSYEAKKEDDCPKWGIADVQDVTEVVQEAGDFLREETTADTETETQTETDTECAIILKPAQQLTVYFDDYFIDNNQDSLGEEGKVAIESMIRTIIKEHKETYEPDMSESDVPEYIKMAVEQNLIEIGTAEEMMTASESVLVPITLYLNKVNSEEDYNFPVYKFNIIMVKGVSEAGCELWMITGSQDITEYKDAPATEEDCAEITPSAKFKSDLDKIFIEKDKESVSEDTHKILSRIYSIMATKESEHGNDVSTSDIERAIAMAYQDMLLGVKSEDMNIIMRIDLNKLELNPDVAFYQYEFTIVYEEYEAENGCPNVRIKDLKDNTSYPATEEASSESEGGEQVADEGTNKDCNVSPAATLLANDFRKYFEDQDATYDSGDAFFPKMEDLIKEFASSKQNMEKAEAVEIVGRFFLQSDISFNQGLITKYENEQSVTITAKFEIEPSFEYDFNYVRSTEGCESWSLIDDIK